MRLVQGYCLTRELLQYNSEPSFPALIEFTSDAFRIRSPGRQCARIQKDVTHGVPTFSLVVPRLLASNVGPRVSYPPELRHMLRSPFPRHLGNKLPHDPPLHSSPTFHATPPPHPNISYHTPNRQKVPTGPGFIAANPHPLLHPRLVGITLLVLVLHSPLNLDLSAPTSTLRVPLVGWLAR